MADIFIGRQPILGRDRRIHAYELLFRQGMAPSASVVDPSKATAKVIVEFLMDVGIENLVGTKLAFINVNEEILNEQFIEILPPRRTVLEILGTCTNVEYLRKCIRRLKEIGFLFALDDSVPTSALAELTTEVDFIKVEVSKRRKEDIARHASHFNAFPVSLVADKVETAKEFKTAYELGFHMFQGFFFAEPTIVRKRALSPEKQVLMQLLAAIEADREPSVIEAHFKRHPHLTYKLLRYINSAFFYVSEGVKSISHAISLLGYKHIRRWVVLLLFALDDENPSDNPLFERAFVRGYMMEQLSKKASFDKWLQESAFITGCLSVMDVLLGMPMREVLRSLSVAAPIEEALLFEMGKLGMLLRVVKAHEACSYEEVEHLLSALHLQKDDVFASEMEAILNFHNMERIL